MTPDDLRALVADIQRRQMELDSIEVKTARQGTPKRLHQALSALANRPGGGVILFGLSEETDFSVVGVGNPHRLQEEVTHLATDQMEPPLRPRFTVDEIDGHVVVAAEIDEAAVEQKPCFFKNDGLPKGAYLRVANTNRQMSEYEVFGYLSARGQPRHDEELVPGATIDDLDPARLDRYLEDLRRARPRADYLHGDRADMLQRLHIVARDGAVLRPTLAGLLVFGKYPQEFFPQLMITFLQYFGTTREEETPQGARFMDNRRFEGPIPEMIEEAEIYVLSALRKASLIEGLLRRDIPEYPIGALREALANAVAHRDYSPYVCGNYIQVRLFADRIEVQSPGGLFGNVNVDNLEDEHSTRNVRLMRLLEDVHVVENRGSGIRTMLQAMREANLEPPRFDDRRSSFWVTFRNHTLMSPPAIAWLNQFAQIPLTDRQRLALVYLRQHEQITNPEYRRLNHVDALVAGAELRGLVQTGLVSQHGAGRWTYYRLVVKLTGPVDEPAAGQSEETRILDVVRKSGAITNGECQVLLGVSQTRAYYLLDSLVNQGKLRGEGAKKGRRYVLP